MADVEYHGTINGSISSEASISGSVSNRRSVTGTAGVSTGTNDYEKLLNLPSIESVQLKGNKTFEELGMSECDNIDIDNLFKSIFG